MIKNWLKKHRWVNESGKTLVAIFFGFFGYAVWQAGKEISFAMVDMSQSYKLMFPGIVVGIMGMLALFLLVDVACSIVGIIRKSNLT